MGDRCYGAEASRGPDEPLRQSREGHGEDADFLHDRGGGVDRLIAM